MTGRGLRAILTYHAVDPSPSPICIEDVTFRRHAAWLASGRVKVSGRHGVRRERPRRPHQRLGGGQAPGIPRLPLMDWETLARLSEAGVELGAHTRSHRDLRGASHAELEDELGGCAQRIARETGFRPSSLAYSRACTAVLRPLSFREDVYRLPRLDARTIRAALAAPGA
jgi:peptidoglycan/xylan/chitin deacetylase (PgdA/CDA1 family)